jgi:hypothetical protein
MRISCHFPNSSRFDFGAKTAVGAAWKVLLLEIFLLALVRPSGFARILEG